MIHKKLLYRLVFLLCLCSQNFIFGMIEREPSQSLESKVALTSSTTAAEKEEDEEEEDRQRIKKEENKEFLKKSITDGLKQYDLKYLDEKKIVEPFIDTLVNKPIVIKGRYQLKFSDITFSACHCSNMNMPNRILLTLCQLNAINKKYPDKTKNFVHTSIGAGQLLQMYMFAYGLLLIGYKKITLCCIDDYTHGFNIKKAQKIFTDLAGKYDASINVIDFENVYAYIDTINNAEVPKSDSFDSIDPANGAPASIPGEEEKIDTEKYSLIVFAREADAEIQERIYENVDTKPFKAPKKLDDFYLYLEYSYDKDNKTWSVRPYFFRNPLYLKNDDENKKQEDIFKELKALEEKSYKTIAELLDQAEPIIKKFSPNFEKVPFFYQPFDFRALVEYARADDNPIIFEGDTNILDANNPRRIWEHTLNSFREKFNPQDSWITVMDPTGKIGGKIDYTENPNSTIDIDIGHTFTRPLMDHKPPMSPIDLLKNQVKETFRNSQIDSFIKYNLQPALDRKEIEQKQFDELKTLIQSNRGNFDAWSNNITLSNQSAFLKELNKAFEDKKNDPDYKKYAAQALKSFVKAAREVSVPEHLGSIDWQFDQFFHILNQLPELAKIAGTQVPEEKELKAQEEQLKTQAFDRYKSEIENGDKEIIKSLHWAIEKRIDRYFTLAKARELKRLFNQQAKRFKAETVSMGYYTQKASQDYNNSLQGLLDDKEISIDKFNELKTFAASTVGDFDTWSKNITSNNYREFLSDLNAAYKDKEDDPNYIKYVQQALNGFIQLAQQDVDIEHESIHGIHQILEQLPVILRTVHELSKIAGTEVPEEKELQAQAELLKTQAFDRYKSEIEKGDKEKIKSLHWIIEDHIDYLTAEQAETLIHLFNQRAKEFDEETILTATEKQELKQKKQQEEQERRLDNLKNEAQECYTQNKLESYIKYTLQDALNNKKINQKQFDELEALARGSVGNFDAWSKNITSNNHYSFIRNLETALEKHDIKEPDYKKYAGQALDGFVKLAQQDIEIEHDEALYRISSHLTQASEMLTTIRQLSDISDVKILEEKELQDRWEQLKIQAFQRYESEIPTCDKDTFQFLSMGIQYALKSCFNLEQLDELQMLFNKRAEELGEETLLIVTEKQKLQEKQRKEQERQQKSLKKREQRYAEEEVA